METNVEYYDEYGNIINKKTNENNNVNNNIDNQPQDVPQKILNNEFYSSGIISDIDENNIYFYNDDFKQFFINKNKFDYINGRTSKKINLIDVKVADYLYSEFF